MKITRRTKLLVVALALCFTTMIGSTFAWFTDSVEVNGNNIQAGTLDVTMEYAKGTEDPANANWQDASSGTLFNYKLWEPGYVQVYHVKIANAGTLALKYDLKLVADGTVSKLAEVIDVYYADPAVQANSRALPGLTKISTLQEFIAQNADNATNTASGNLQAGQSHTVTLALKMREEAGNEYQGMAIGSSFNLVLNATQLMSESDSFGNEYDEDAGLPGDPILFRTVPELNEALKKLTSEAVVLRKCTDKTTPIEIPAAYTGTLTLENVTINSIVAEDTANVMIVGDVTVQATSGSAITGMEINLSGSGNLTAIAADENGAFGIGGMNTEKITIKDLTIEEARGGFDGQSGTDKKYYKDAPEGGSAIGSGHNGAVIELDNLRIVKAIGGSKAAGIGARYWTGVTVTINNSTIDYVEGGVTAAGIGGSRVSEGATENGNTINITNSMITAQGGVYAAGIGAGYDTHCQSSQPLCTINIDGSTINAYGGQYAAGVGTGYHNAALAGEIKNSTITAVSGEKIYKDTYTQAQDIGFGVVDPAREGQQTSSKLIYNGTAIEIPAVTQ